VSNGPATPDETCGVFGTLDGNLDRRKVHSFVVGVDRAPRPMGAAEAKRELGDPFATLLLLEGVFPRTAEDCLEAIDRATKRNNPLRKQLSFLVGETSQLPRTAKVQRAIRFVITRGSDGTGPPRGPDVLLSVSFPDQTDIELMAWDRKRGGFNYYRAVGPGPTWVFAGNARAALVDPSQGKGAFESHKSGAFLMKELKLPWLNWDSPQAPIGASAFPRNDPRVRHPWFRRKEPGGAYTFEFAVARPAIERWAKARFDELAVGGTVDDPHRVLDQILGTPSANLASSLVESARARSPKVQIDLPLSFFMDTDGLGEVGIFPSEFLTVGARIYRNTLKRFDVRLDDGRGFERKGDTHFAFAVPERAFEDTVTLREAMRVGLVTRRLAACLLMVDFPNPVFSDRRAKLLDHVPDSATIKKGKSTFSDRMARAVLKAAENSPEDSPEREFAERWKVGPRFGPAFNRDIRRYLAAVKRRLKTQGGFNDYWRLADRRRAQARENPVFAEFALLFPKSDVPRPARRMRRDGTVV
jgi:hypothetical protein